ncbi:hypothetical protein L198_00565 [Cryptococcus wingfieldii CBS 7118]|uniref:Helitron helicase-like domain-containing protein n=1 Tax=Cryptococcus wingfieldii CBS 7118 TaxID=1295528 RepID=A0A1E3K9A8_9TREE|nr:hypothetical protein L198_00565 [Cryptococcus wingfieldii CBS 7118]ODO08832.1 hypothetical protein L198_00565 [Cryptococcus wingfieldii CBS 7118]
MSSSMFGSVGSHRNRRKELRALLRHSGMPSLFVTLNPADSKNFVVSVMAGRDVDLDERLGLSDELKEEVSQRFSAASADHGACAEGFHFMVEKFINVFLPYGSPEALHIHMLIWLEHAPSPLELRKHEKENPEWAAEVCRWLDTVMSGSLPEGAVPSGRYPPCDDDALAFRQRGDHRSLPLLQPPPHLPPHMSEEDWQRVRQDVMEVLECGQLHDHSFTCFKHLPKLRRAQKLGDADCRFKFPKEEVLHTHFNDDGTIDVQRTHPKLNMYNLIMVGAFRCNMDIKFVGSGMMAMAAVYYISNYISKVALDTPTMFAAIEARFRRGNGRLLGQEAERVGETGAEARQRQMKSLLVRSCNTLTGKQELSSEQVMHHLLGYPHRYTNARFQNVKWWDIARHLGLSNSKLAPATRGSQGSEDVPVEADRLEESLDLDEMPRPTGGDVEQTVTLLRMGNPDDELRHSGGSYAVDDYIRRPNSLSSVCYWDFVARYQKLTAKSARKKGPQKAAPEFLPSHPQFSAHRIQTRRTPVVPILSGPTIPRDSAASAEEHARTMLALFKPWRSPADLVPADGSTSKELSSCVNC